MIVYPTSPATCRVRHYVFALHGAGRGLLAPVVARLVRLGVLRVTKQLFLEDATIYEEVQRGLVASPHAGVIGTREERIYAFQGFVLGRCGHAGAGPPMDADAAAAESASTTSTPH